MKRCILLACLPLMAVTAFAQSLPGQKAVTDAMRRVADWQIEAQPQVRWPAGAWHNGPLYNGMLDWGELAEKTAGDRSYIRWVEGIGNGMRWTPITRRGNNSHADDICVPQAWLRLHERFGGKGRIKETRARLDAIMAKLKDVPDDFRRQKRLSQDRWIWCDALYMAPATFVQLSVATKDAKYLDFMHREFTAATNFLYDREEHLYYRDAKYFPYGMSGKGKPNLESNGKKIFWGRGNGWVFGGLANILRAMPKDAKVRPYYENLFKEMAARLVRVQSPDGYWHASLLNPEAYPAPETSASGFIVYGLAWGINNGYLDRAAYLPAVTKGWNALVKAVHPDGKLGYVQPVGAAPGKVTKDMTEVYGVGAFLQAGAQVWKLSGTAK